MTLPRIQNPSSDNAIESPVSITINGIAHAVMMITPNDLENFAVGFCFSEGIIDHVDQVRDIQISENKHPISNSGTASPAFAIDSVVLDLVISPRQLQSYKEKQHFRRGLTSCGLCGIESLDIALPELNLLPISPSPCPETLASIHQSTEFKQGLHLAQLFDPQGTLLTAQEDIGRHNALDKVLGYALRNNLNLHQHYAVLTSRCSVELVQKAVRAGLSTLVHLSSPSNLAVEMARHYKLNLIQVARSGEIKIYSESSRSEL